MKNMFIIYLLIIAFIIIGCAGNCKTKNDLDVNTSSVEADVLSGILYVAGNEPFSYLALDTTDRTVFKIECSDSLKKELWQLQGKTVKFNINELKKSDILNVAVVKSYSIIDTEKDLEE